MAAIFFHMAASCPLKPQADKWIPDLVRLPSSKNPIIIPPPRVEGVYPMPMAYKSVVTQLIGSI